MNYKANGAVALLIFVLGCLVLVYDNPTISRAVLIVCGVAFFLPGLLSVLGAFFGGRAKVDEKSVKNKKVAPVKPGKSSFARAIGLICGFGGIGLGVCIWLMPDVFQPVIVWLFAALLIVGGVYQLSLLSSGRREVAYPGWLIIGPILTVAAGVVLICVPYFRQYGQGFERNEFWMMLVTGVCMLIFGIVGVVMAYLTGVHRHRERKAAKAAAKAAETEAKTAAETAKEAAKPAGKVDDKLTSALKISSDADTKNAPAAPADEYQGH